MQHMYMYQMMLMVTNHHSWVAPGYKLTFWLIGWETKDREEAGHKWAPSHQEKEKEIQRSWEPV